MNDRAGGPTWSALSIVIALIVVALLAPRSWRSVAIPEGKQGVISASDPRCETPRAADEHPKEPADRSSLHRVAAPIVVARCEGGQVLADEVADCEAGTEAGPELVEPAPSAAPAVEPAPPEETQPLASRQVLTSLATDAAASRSAAEPEAAPAVADERRQAAKKIAEDGKTAKDPSTTRLPWPYPTALAARLKRLSAEPAYRELAEQTMAELQRLGAVPSLAAPAEAELRRLRTRAEEMRGQAEAADGSSTRVELARAGYDLVRRLDIWEQVQAAASDGQASSQAKAPVEYAALLRELEDYENDAAATTAKRLADYCRRLSQSSRASDLELARRLETHYRNANVRVAVSQELINRLLPAPAETEAPVRDEILGARVVGRSTAGTRLSVVLLPHRRQWRVGLEADGDVVSKTSATKGPVTFFNTGFSNFSVLKVLTLDPDGIQGRRAEAVADCNADLVGLRTRFDDVPLLRQLARAVARQQHERRREEANWEAATKLAAQAGARLDQEVRQQLDKANEQLEAKVLKPLNTLELDPCCVNLETTSERLVARFRLAADDQLAAHTPRPRAWSDSLFSTQVHETSLNNAIDQLGLDGRRADVRDLYCEIAKAFEFPNPTIPEDFPENVTVQFAASDAVRVRCDNGRAILTIKLDQLANGRKQRWRNFAVRAFYRPEVNRLTAKLVRDENFELVGERLRFGDRVALGVIFSKVFSRRRPIPIIGEQLAEKPQLDGLHVNQFMIDDGWIAVALGPRARVIERLADGPGEPTSAAQRK